MGNMSKLGIKTIEENIARKLFEFNWKSSEKLWKQRNFWKC